MALALGHTNKQMKQTKNPKTDSQLHKHLTNDKDSAIHQ